jgi:MioC protein
MSKSIVILFGTESGNAEFAAEDIASSLGDSRHVRVVDMTDFDLDEFDPENFYILISSTHGEGEVPSGAKPFVDALNAESPDLTGIEFAVFGLGDSTYEHYSRGSEVIAEKLIELGAKRVGEYGRHDASDGTLPNDSAVEWAEALVTSR